MSISKKKVEMPLISIIVPVYNVEEYLSRCIESILRQTHRNLELILVDDGSSDGSYSICQEYEQKDSRITVLQQENAGSSVARNTGLKIANGEYIGFVDSDDWIQPAMFEDMITFAIQQNLQVVECGQITSKEIDTNIDVKSTFLIESKEEAMERIIKTDRFAVWKRIYQKEVLKNKTFIPGKIHQDVFYTMDVLDLIDNMGLINNKYYVYNVDNESIIRSDYSLKKLDAKDAVYYVKKISLKYNERLKELGNIYLIKGLLSHYISLSSHEKIDPDYKFRKQLKSEIKQQYYNLPKGIGLDKIRAFTAIILPYRFYRLLLNFNNSRINLKLKILKVFNV